MLTKAFFVSLHHDSGGIVIERGVARRPNKMFKPLHNENNAYAALFPASLTLQLIDEHGTIYDFNIIRAVRQMNAWQRITQKRFSLLEEKLKSNDYFTIETNASGKKHIADLNELVKI